MRRREFITLVGGAAAWPLAARTQPSAMPVIGYLSTRSPDESANLLAAFRHGLAESGAVESQNVAVEYRWALGAYDRLQAMSELTHRPVDVLVTVGGEPSALAASVATKMIPIVAIFADDPVESGLVASLGRPGGNTTGVFALNPTLEAKRLGLLRELVPKGETIGVLLNPDYPPATRQLKDVEQAASSVGLKTYVLRASTDAQIETAFATVMESHISAIAVTSDPFINTRRDTLVTLAARHRVPAMYPFREHVVVGGLMSYGVDLSEMYRQVTIYAGRVLKGEKPADLPVMQPTKFEFVINLKTAKALGIKFSDNLMSLADEVIE